MPTRVLTICSYPGCKNLVTHGRCEVHTSAAPVFYRDTERQRLYDRKWQRRRAVQLAAHPWCERCLIEGIYTPAFDVHHVLRHRGNRELFDSSPLESLCHAHHSQETAAEVNEDKRAMRAAGEGGQKVLDRGASSARGLPREKNSQCGKSG